MKQDGNIPSSSVLWKGLCASGIASSLDAQLKPPVKPSGIWSFLNWKSFNFSFNIFNRGYSNCSSSSQVSFIKLWFLKNLSVYQCYQIYCHKVICNIPLLFFRASQVALVVKNPLANAGDTRDMGSIPGWGRSPGGGHGDLLQYSCLENPMDRGVWRAAVHTLATPCPLNTVRLLTAPLHYLTSRGGYTVLRPFTSSGALCLAKQ